MSNTAKRPYIVTHGSQVHLVSAANKSQAIRYLADREIKARAASANEVLDLVVTHGVELEHATPEQQEMEGV